MHVKIYIDVQFKRSRFLKLFLDGGPLAELPENWDQTKDDNQSLFLNKSDKNDLEPYPLALSEEGNYGKEILST